MYGWSFKTCYYERRAGAPFETASQPDWRINSKHVLVQLQGRHSLDLTFRPVLFPETYRCTVSLSAGLRSCCSVGDKNVSGPSHVPELR